MKIVIALDSFKGCRTSMEAGNAVATGLRRIPALAGAEITVLPVADGGEGTVEALLTQGGQKVTATVTGPLGMPVQASYAMLTKDVAVIEMAAAAGLMLVEAKHRNPERTTTFGVGELLTDAAGRGAKRILLGLGGSATCDGGLGLAAALGVRFCNKEGRPLTTGGELSEVARVEGEPVTMRGVTIEIACDVQNPLCGPAGTACVFAPQKGANAEMVARLEQSLQHYRRFYKYTLHSEAPDLPGAGAAGGIALPLLHFLNAKLRPGIELVLEALNFSARLRGASLVITGEGRLDAQTAMGKAPLGIAARAQAAGVPVIALAGELGEGYQTLYEKGITAAFAIQPGPRTLEQSIRHAAMQLSDTACAAGRAFLAGLQAK